MKKKNNITYPVGVIDVGSNSVRLLYTDGVFFEKNVITTRLGEGLTENNTLTIDSIMRSVKAVNDLYSLAKDKGATNVYVFATAAVRQANNGCDFVNLVKTTVGLDVDVVSGDKEALLGIKGAIDGLSGGIIDVGGASTEIAVLKNGEVVYQKSLPIGAVKLYTKFGRNRQEIDRYVKEVIKGFACEYKCEFKGIGGTATCLGAVDLKLKTYQSNLIDGHYISAENLSKIVDELYLLSPSEIVDKYAVLPKRADIIAGGASIILEILNHLKTNGIITSEKDNLEGYLHLLNNEE